MFLSVSPPPLHLSQYTHVKRVRTAAGAVFLLVDVYLYRYEARRPACEQFLRRSRVACFPILQQCRAESVYVHVRENEKQAVHAVLHISRSKRVAPEKAVHKERATLPRLDQQRTALSTTSSVSSTSYTSQLNLDPNPNPHV